MAKKKIALLSNITVDLIKQKLNKKFDVYIPEGYNTWIQHALNPNSSIYTEKADAVIALLDGVVAEDWSDSSLAEENLNMWKQGITALTENISDIPVFISTIDFKESRIRALSERKFKLAMQYDWYQFVQSIVENKNNVYVFDLADKIADIGRQRFYSNKMWYMGNMPYSREGLQTVCEMITCLMDSAFEPRKKIIVLDLDNTLWGGVIGEDGIEGIELSNHKEGQRFYDFQRQLKEMQERGVLLAIASKNNPEEAENAINDHPYMVLRDDSFVSRKINWETKAKSIKDLESELNLTEGSFVFIDDNPAEREVVKRACPEVLVPEFPLDTTVLENFSEDLFNRYFLPLRVLEEDKDKTKMYQAEARRKQDFSLNFSLNFSLDDYLEKLGLVAEIHRMREDEIDRVVQLCGKTNQFNVTTKRYTREEITGIQDDKNNAIYVAYLDDKYGKSGLVCVLILLGLGKEKTIDTFLMSCRVMGRKLEDVMINELVRCYKKNTERFIAEYIPTAKNAPVKDLYDRLGFSLTDEQNGDKTYELRLADFKETEFPFYKEICFMDT